MAEQNEAMEDFLFTHQLSLREALRIFQKYLECFRNQNLYPIDISKHSGAECS